MENLLCTHKGDSAERYLFGEIVFDITTCAMEVMRRAADARPLAEWDSRDLYYAISKWAEEFMETNPDPEDYMTEVEEFAYAKLAEYFGE